jgi:hypothetical protein
VAAVAGWRDDLEQSTVERYDEWMCGLQEDGTDGMEALGAIEVIFTKCIDCQEDLRAQMLPLHLGDAGTGSTFGIEWWCRESRWYIQDGTKYR